MAIKGGLTPPSPLCQCANLASPASWTCVLVPNTFQMILIRISVLVSVEPSESNKVGSLTQTVSHPAFWHWIELASPGCAASPHKHKDNPFISLRFDLRPVRVSSCGKLGAMTGMVLGPGMEGSGVMMGMELGSVIKMSGGMGLGSVMELELDETESGMMSGSQLSFEGSMMALESSSYSLSDPLSDPNTS